MKNRNPLSILLPVLYNGALETSSQTISRGINNMILNPTDALFKRAARFALLVLFLCLATPAMAESKWDGTSTAPSSGDGSAESPYVIDSAAKLAGLRKRVETGQNSDNHHYRLTTDIDLARLSWQPIGNITQPFGGSFDGQGHVIRNLYIKSLNTNNQGLFGYVKSADISNIGLLNVDINCGNNTGSLVGYASKSVIEGAFVFGTVSGGVNTGGLAGFVTETHMNRCFSAAIVNGDENSVGGLVGVAATTGNTLGTASAITNSYVSGPVSGLGSFAGGILGTLQLYGLVSNSYIAGSVHNHAKGTYAASSIGNLMVLSMASNVVSDPQETGQGVILTRGGGKTENTLVLPTDLFTNGKLPAPLSPDCFVASIDSYPELRHFQAHSSPAFRNASALSAVPVFFTEKSTSLACDGVLEVPIRDSQKNELHWNLPAGAGVFIASGKPNRAILLLAHGERTFEVSNDIKGGSKPFFVSADVEKGMEIALSPGSNDKTSHATVKYNDTSIDQAIVRFVASGDNTEYIASTDIPTDEEGVATYEIPAGTPAGSYDVHATIPGTAWKSNHIKRDVAPLPDPPAPDDLDPPTPDDPASPDITPPDDPDNPEPAPNPTPPQPESDDIASDDEAPGSSPGNCNAGLGSFLPFWGMTLVGRLIKLRR